MKIDLKPAAGVRQGQDLRVPRHSRAVRSARAARASPTSSSTTTATCGSRTCQRRPACLGSEGLLRPRHRLVRRQRRTAGSTSTSATTPTPNFLYMNQKNGTFKEVGFPMGVAVSEDGAEQGSMGIALGDYDHSRPVQHLRHQLRRGVQRPLPQRRRPLHRRVVPIANGRGQPALRRLGQRVLRLRQRQLARPHRGERSRLSAARSGAARRVGGLSPAQAALPQPRQRDLRRGGREIRIRVHRRARQPRPRDRRPRQRRRRWTW